MMSSSEWIKSRDKSPKLVKQDFTSSAKSSSVLTIGSKISLRETVS
ncbi:unnamed protein product [Schistosoma mattheei]|uniref:Uncharacterized protein n=1 Tax=Schistosoma mattheei TaxID=31246 RepID=A0A183Q5V7_9TREM|nr:unnamed protein product [Schistosoma mattheei]